MAGRPPDDLANQFAADTFTLTTHQLAVKYSIAESTVRDWRLHCRRKLELAVGYGAGRSTVEQPVITGVTADNELDPDELWAAAFRAQDRTVRAKRRSNQGSSCPTNLSGSPI